MVKRKTTTKDAHKNELAKIIKSVLRKEGSTAADLGVILGALDDEQAWLLKLKKTCNTLDEFLAAARQRADVALVVATVKEAKGYDYEETTQTFTPEVDDEGKPTGEEVPGKIKRNKKRVKGDSSLLKFLMTSRMPESFNETKRIEIEKRTIEIKGAAEAEIRGFAGKLLKAMGGEQDAKFVESKTLETE